MFHYFDITFDLPVTAKPEKVKDFLLNEVGAIFVKNVRHNIYSIIRDNELETDLVKEYPFIKDVSLVYNSDFLSNMTDLKK